MFLAIPTEIEDGRSRSDVPAANGLIIFVNVVLFCLRICTPVGPGTSLYSIVGYGFSHASLDHLLFNMWVLLVVGNAVNRRIGNRYYALCYFGTILIIGLFARLFAGQFLVGSSGAIFAMIAILTMLMPTAWSRISYIALFPVTLVVGIFARPGHWLYWLIRFDSVRLRAIWLLLLVPAMELLGLFWWRSWSNVGHLLGFACGVVFVAILPARVSMHRYWQAGIHA